MEIKLNNKILNKYMIFDLNEFLEQYGFDYILNKEDLIIYINASIFEKSEYKEFINDLIDYVEIENLEYIKFNNN